MPHPKITPEELMDTLGTAKEAIAQWDAGDEEAQQQNTRHIFVLESILDAFMQTPIGAQEKLLDAVHAKNAHLFQ